VITPAPGKAMPELETGAVIAACDRLFENLHRWA